jgi:uncharacterized protein YecT (DUF1311 family)
MRSFGSAIALASTLLSLAACDDAARVESAASRARDSAHAHDLQVAGGDSAVARSPATTISESSGGVEAPLRTGAGAAPVANASLTASSSPAPSAEGYVGPSCASPALEDQRRCLLGYLARSDVQLDRSYQMLIDRLKTEAGSRDGAAEPPAVQRLRTAQRAWLVYRDDECRKRTIDSEGPLWAPVRAKCLAEYSALRTRELGDALAKRPAIATAKRPAIATQTKAQPRSKATASKRTSARKSTRSRKSRSR